MGWLNRNDKKPTEDDNESRFVIVYGLINGQPRWYTLYTYDEYYSKKPPKYDPNRPDETISHFTGSRENAIAEADRKTKRN